MLNNELTTKMGTIEALRPNQTPTQLERVGFVLDSVMSQESRQASLFKEIVPAETLVVPNFLGKTGDKLVVPSLKVVTPLDHEARLVTLEGSDKTLQKMFSEAEKVKKGTSAASEIDDRTHETLVRILDTPANQGVHHIHGTDLPNTVYFIAKRGNGIMLNVYLSEVGQLDTPNGDKIPVFARLTATKDKKSEYDFFKRVGAGNQKGKYNH